MKYQGVFIVTYGRSGSTLLQGLLNSIDGCLVRGENHNLCYRLFQAYTALLQSQQEIVKARSDSGSPTNPWFGALSMSADAFLDDVAALLRRQLLGEADPATVTCLGFKEIRYPGLEGLSAYLDFLERVLPGSAFVFLTRDHASVSRSAWWKTRDPATVDSDLTAFENQVREWARERTNFFHIDYADLSGHGAAVPALFAFLGAPYEREAVEAVLSTPHSYAANDSAPVMRPQKPREPVLLAFDPLPEAFDVAVGTVIGGVVLVQDVDPASAGLQAWCGDLRLAATWGLPSPKVAAQYPDDPRAAVARFRIDLPAGSKADAIELRLVVEGAEPVVLGRLALPRNAAS